MISTGNMIPESINLPTSPVYCGCTTFRNSKESYFNHVIIHTFFWKKLKHGVQIAKLLCVYFLHELMRVIDWCVSWAGPVAGESSARDGIPFVIEWIPDILPQSHIGEMRIQFEFGHQCNGVIQHRPAAAAAPADTSIRQITCWC